MSLTPPLRTWIPDVSATLRAFPAVDGQRVDVGVFFDEVVLYCTRTGGERSVLELPLVEGEAQIVIYHDLLAATIPLRGQPSPLLECLAGECPELDLAGLGRKEACQRVAGAWEASLLRHIADWTLAASVASWTQSALTRQQAEAWMQELIEVSSPVRAVG